MFSIEGFKFEVQCSRFEITRKNLEREFITEDTKKTKGKNSAHSASSLFHFMPYAMYLIFALRAQAPAHAIAMKNRDTNTAAFAGAGLDVLKKGKEVF